MNNFDSAFAKRPLWAHSISEAAEAIRKGSCAASDYVKACIERAKKVEPRKRTSPKGVPDSPVPALVKE